MAPSTPIILAQTHHLPMILEVFGRCTDHMLANGISQWHYDYPDAETIKKDIARKEVFVWQEESLILGTITLNGEQSSQYASVKWKWEEGRALVIHRLAVSPKAQGQGIGRQLCQFAEDYAREKHYAMIRLDAYSGNPASQKLYKKLAYQKAEGLCWFHDNEFPFNCWEKRIL